MMAVLLTACGHRASQQAQDVEEDSTEVVGTTAFKIDSIHHEQEDSTIGVKICVDWPDSDNDSLEKSIRNYICETMAVDVIEEEEPEVHYYDDGKKAVMSAFQHKYQQLKAMWDDIVQNNEGIEPSGMPFTCYLRVRMLEDGGKYITYLSNSEGYLGGAHGYATSTGITFRKSDGKRIGYTTKYNEEKEIFEHTNQTLFKNPRSKALNDILKEGLRSYFQEFQDEPVTDDVLIEQLIELNNLEDIPLPNHPPIFTKDGLSFTYQQYEIAAYAAGMPNFNIPYEKISSCLTDDAKVMIP